MAATVADVTLQNLTSTLFRPPYSTSASPSMAESLPPLNFKFDELRASMNEFTKRFDAFIEQGRKMVLEERNQFRMSIAEVQEQHSTTTRNISSIRAQSSTHASTITAQTAETNEMQTQIASLTTTRDLHLATVAALRSRLASAKGTITSKKSAQKQRRMYLEHQGSFNAPELRVWEDVLGLRIEGAEKPDRVRFVFQGLDARNRDGRVDHWGESRCREREVFFDLDMNGGGYEIVECRPRLDRGAVENYLGLMKENEDLRGFLKGMRELFADDLGRR